MAKLNQVIAIEKGVKARSHAVVTDLYHQLDHPAVFSGLSRTFQPNSENDDALPPERKQVQIRMPDVLAQLEKALSEELDTQAHREKGNMTAKAAIVVDGVEIIPEIPAGMILALEKRLIDLRTFIGKIPVLDNAESWRLDPNSDLYVTDAVQTRSTRKAQRPLVLYHATEHHPAQTQMITEDVVTGIWSTIKQSGAIPRPAKMEMIERIDKLILAVKQAREKANDADAGERPSVGAPVFNYLFGR